MHRGLLALVIFINLVRFPVWAAEPQQCWVVFLLPRFNEQQLHIDADPGCWLSLTLSLCAAERTEEMQYPAAQEQICEGYFHTTAMPVQRLEGPGDTRKGNCLLLAGFS